MDLALTARIVPIGCCASAGAKPWSRGALLAEPEA